MLQLMLLFLSVASVSGVPYMLLKNKAPKCFQVTTKPGQTLILKYHAPDLILVDEDKPASEGDAVDTERKLEDGLDAMYNERFQKRMQELKKSHLKDINVSITPRDAAGALISNRSLNKQDKLPQKKREQLEQVEGSFTYDTKELEGSVEVCIQSYAATVETPSRVSLSIEPMSNEEYLIEKRENEERIRNEKLEVENKLVKTETSRITSELVRMHRRAKSIAGDAQFSKEREETFFHKSVTLNRAVRYWPMFRLFVLMLGGYLQVSHVVQYMKRRHIC